MYVAKLGVALAFALTLVAGSARPVQADCSQNDCYDQYGSWVPCDACQYSLVTCYGWDEFGNYTQCVCPTCEPPPATADSQFNAQVVPIQVAACDGSSAPSCRFTVADSGQLTAVFRSDPGVASY